MKIILLVMSLLFTIHVYAGLCACGTGDVCQACDNGTCTNCIPESDLFNVSSSN